MSPTVRTVAMTASFRLAQVLATDARKSFCAVRPRSSPTHRSTQSTPQVYWIETPNRLVESALLAKALVDRASQGSFLQPLEQVSVARPTGLAHANPDM